MACYSNSVLTLENLWRTAFLIHFHLPFNSLNLEYRGVIKKFRFILTKIQKSINYRLRWFYFNVLSVEESILRMEQINIISNFLGVFSRKIRFKFQLNYSFSTEKKTLLISWNWQRLNILIYSDDHQYDYSWIFKSSRCTGCAKFNATVIYIFPTHSCRFSFLEPI